MDLFVLAAISLVFLVVLLRSVHTVKPGQMAIVERLGRFSRTLEPGIHLLVPVVDHLKLRLPMTEQAIAIGDEPVISQDDLVLRADVRVTVVVVDPTRAAYQVADPIDEVRTATIHHLREGVGAVGSDEAFDRGSSLIADLRIHLGPQLREWGLRLVSVDGAISRRSG